MRSRAIRSSRPDLFGPAGPYVPGGYVVDERRGPGMPDFDALDDDERRTRRARRRCCRPAPCFRRTIRVMGRAPGLFGPRPADADGSGYVAG